jgi:hypothetical protein
MTDRRREPLPWQAPKPADDDPDAPARLAAIMASPSYLPADADPAFLQRADMRGERLQLDYAKAETLLAAAGIDHTIEVYRRHPECHDEQAAALIAGGRDLRGLAPGRAGADARSRQPGQPVGRGGRSLPATPAAPISPRAWPGRPCARC